MSPIASFPRRYCCFGALKSWNLVLTCIFDSLPDVLVSIAFVKTTQAILSVYVRFPVGERQMWSDQIVLSKKTTRTGMIDLQICRTCTLAKLSEHMFSKRGFHVLQEKLFRCLVLAVTMMFYLSCA